jgi:N-dimethylarginine dimethylaminohydrolase
MKKSVLMCPPTFFDVREPKNPHMGLPIDRVRACHQWQNLSSALESCGLGVRLLDPVRDLDDMVFTANQIFVGSHSEIGKFALPSRMRHPSRQKEVTHFVDWFRRNGYRIIALDLAGECLEGHGDLIWHPDRSLIWAGYGFRSTAGGVQKFSAAMQSLGFPVEPLELIDAHFYHLDTCFCPIGPNTVLVYGGAFSAASLGKICRTFPRVYEFTRDDALQFVLNGIAVNGRYITPRLTPQLERVLEQEKLEPLVVETSEFEKSGGSVFCMKTFLE